VPGKAGLSARGENPVNTVTVVAVALLGTFLACLVCCSARYILCGPMFARRARIKGIEITRQIEIEGMSSAVSSDQTRRLSAAHAELSRKGGRRESLLDSVAETSNATASSRPGRCSVSNRLSRAMSQGGARPKIQPSASSFTINTERAPRFSIFGIGSSFEDEDPDADRMSERSRSSANKDAASIKPETDQQKI
jgi:hypothetical protein